MSNVQRDDAQVERPAPHRADDDTPVVLIADDEEPIAEALGDIIEEAGYHAILARDGRRALELALGERPALVITDYMMPYLNGAQLMLAVREDAHSRGQSPPPMVLMSAAGRPYLDGTLADAIIGKPFDIAEIDALLHRLVGASGHGDG